MRRYIRSYRSLGGNSQLCIGCHKTWSRKYLSTNSFFYQQCIQWDQSSQLSRTRSIWYVNGPESTAGDRSFYLTTMNIYDSQESVSSMIVSALGESPIFLDYRFHTNKMKLLWNLLVSKALVEGVWFHALKDLDPADTNILRIHNRKIVVISFDVDSGDYCSFCYCKVLLSINLLDKTDH